MSTSKKILTAVGIFAVGLGLGFLLGRLFIKTESVVETKEVVKYVPSPYVVRDTVKNIVPYETLVRDTVIKYLTAEVDTPAVIKDYHLSRKYNLDFSNDSIGTFVVDAEVNQNKLVNATSFIRPMVKTVYKTETITDYKVPALQFYGMIGTAVNLKTNKISFGLDLKQRYLVGVSGIRYDDNYTYTIDFGVKF
jgi:hypothetical protein